VPEPSGELTYMTEYKRPYPLFALCGLNCGLCPRYHTEGTSKCPGCDGPDFHLKHPSCAVINCNKKHNNVEFCFQCSSYPCPKYSTPGKADSFITYKNVISDFEKAAKEGLIKYREELDRKVKILGVLIDNYNDGKRKNFYCLAVNLLDLTDLENIMKKIENEINRPGLDQKQKIKSVVELFESIAEKNNIELVLRKP
jgi:hypothetical protein